MELSILSANGFRRIIAEIQNVATDEQTDDPPNNGQISSLLQNNLM